MTDDDKLSHTGFIVTYQFKYLDTQ